MPRHHTHSLILAALTGSLLLTTVCAALTQNAPPDEQDTGVSELLDPTPLIARSLGLEMHIPHKARVQPQRTDKGISIVISEDSDNPRWSMRVQQMASSLLEPTAEGEVDDHLASLEANRANFKLLSRRALTISGEDAHECYIRQVAANDEPYVSGWLIISNGPGTFLVISSLTLPHVLPDVQPLFDACFKTIKLKTLEERSRATLAQMVNGQKLLERVDESTLRKMLGETMHLRTYLPASATQDGAEREVGWSTIEIYEAKRGAVNPQRIEFDYDATEHDVGLMVHVTAQMVEQRSEPHIYNDIEAFYWLSWDQQTEQWSVRATRRQGDASVSSAETGLRMPPDGPTEAMLFVSKQNDDTRLAQPSQWNVPPVYLSQALRWLLPMLMPRDIDQPVEYGWYFYDFTAPAPALSRRLDRWEPAGNRWKLTTTMSTDAAPTESLYANDGSLIQQKIATGAITEQMPLEQIQRIWRTKGLLRDANRNTRSTNKPTRVDR